MRLPDWASSKCDPRVELINDQVTGRSVDRIADARKTPREQSQFPKLRLIMLHSFRVIEWVNLHSIMIPLFLTDKNFSLSKTLFADWEQLQLVTNPVKTTSFPSFFSQINWKHDSID